MKTCSLISFLILFTLLSKGQQYSFPLYFEDSAGNRDTLYFGEDFSATFGIDEQLGEVNLIGNPIDSTFTVFFTDAVTGSLYGDSFDCYLEKTQELTYISKKQYNSFHNNLYDWIELGMISKNWPVTISWDQGKLSDYVSKQGNPKWNFYMYSWNPPVSLTGHIHCCGNWPNDYTLLNETSQVSVAENNFCQYATTISKDTVNLFFIYYSFFTGLAESVKANESFIYNPEEKTIVFLNNGNPKSGVIEVYDLWGKVWIRKSIDNFTDTNMKIDAGLLAKGTYILRFSSTNYNSLTKKILIL